MPNGFLNLWKPPGISSYAAVTRARRALGEDRAGHGGTLDPEAQGVLPVALGECTRLLSLVDFNPKVYRAEVEVGFLTHTGDALGRPIALSRPWVWSVEQLSWAAQWFLGEGWQVPPQVSALKIGGRRQYDVVRQGGVVWPSPRRVTISEIRAIEPTHTGWRFDASVSSGTYVRALVRDWGYLLGTAATMTDLTRIRSGPFHSHDAVPLDGVAERGLSALRRWDAILSLPIWPLTAKEADWVRHGNGKGLARLTPEMGPLVALTLGQELLGITEGPPWRYRMVFKEGI